jgi:hypothetical protein
MSDVPTSAKPVFVQADGVVPGSKGSGRLLRRTFVIALVLVSGGLLTSGLVELFFRYPRASRPSRRCNERWPKGGLQDSAVRAGHREDLTGIDAGARNHRRPDGGLSV